MFDDKLRPLKESLLTSISEQIGKIITPNQMTLFSLFMGIISSYLIFKGRMKLALVFWVLNRILDGLDGTIARVTKRQTDLGGYLDILSDFLIYALIPLSFVFSRGYISTEMVTLTIMLSVFYFNSASWMYLSSIIEKRNNKNSSSLTSVNMPSGLVEGFETIIIFTLFYIFPNHLVVLFIIMSLFTFLGAIQRIIWAFKNL